MISLQFTISEGAISLYSFSKLIEDDGTGRSGRKVRTDVCMYPMNWYLRTSAY